MYAVVHNDVLVAFSYPLSHLCIISDSSAGTDVRLETSVICSLTVMQHNHVESSSKAMQD